MDIGTVLNTIWDLLNTPIGISAVAGGILLGLNRLYAAKPEWAAYEGTIISAIQFAEKMVPDDTQNRPIAKLNTALSYVLKVYDSTHKRKASKKLQSSLVQGIQIQHEKMEATNHQFALIQKMPPSDPIPVKPHLPDQKGKKK